MKCPHCETEISEHPASRCLDAWVAEAVFGLKPRHWDDHWMGHDWTVGIDDISHRVRRFSTDIAAAWEVVMHFKERQYSVLLEGADAYAWSRWDFRIWNPFTLPIDDPDTADEMAHGWDESVDLNERVASASLAICRAAIKATINE